jgi:hypothetical protein
MHDHEAGGAQPNVETRNIIFFFWFVQTHTRTTAAAQKKLSQKAAKLRRIELSIKPRVFLSATPNEGLGEALGGAAAMRAARVQAQQLQRRVQACESGTRQKRGGHGISSSLFTVVTSGFVTEWKGIH